MKSGHGRSSAGLALTQAAMAVLDSSFLRPQARRYINVVWGAGSRKIGIQNGHNGVSPSAGHWRAQPPCAACEPRRNLLPDGHEIGAACLTPEVGRQE